MKKWYFLLLTIFFMQDHIHSQNECFDPSQVCDSCFCIALWEPVCGCDGKIYSNSCVAYISGITSWILMDEVQILGDTRIVRGDSNTLTATGCKTYYWNTGSNNHTITVSPELTISYMVTVWFVNGCQLSEEVVIMVDEPTDLSDMATTPNSEENTDDRIKMDIDPKGQSIRVESSGKIKSVAMLDVKGQLEIIEEVNAYEYLFFTGNLYPGIHIIQVHFVDGTSTIKKSTDKIALPPTPLI